MNLGVTPVGGGTTNYPGTCVAAGAGTSGTCTVPFTAAPGPTTLSGTLTESGNVIARFNQIQIIQPSTINTVTFTANPVVASVTLQLAATSINAGTPQDVALTVIAKDANGNTIAGTAPYVDANGNPVSLALATVNSQNGGKGTASIRGSSRISAPGQGAISLHYDGNWLDHTVVSATANSSAVTMTGATATLTTIPHATEFAAAGNPFFIATGPDGNLWFTEWNGNAIGKMTPTGNYTPYPCGACSQPHCIMAGPDGNFWFTEAAGHYVSKITTTGAVTRVLPIASGGLGIQTGPDGNIWYSSDGASLIGKLSPGGVSLGTYPMGAQIRGIGFAPDASLWYAEIGSTTIGHISITGASLGTFTVGNQGASSDGVIYGPDGNIWITNFGSNALDKVSLAGAVTPIALQAGSNPRSITVGPDGNIWFSEPGKNTIGVFALTSSTLTEFTAANGINGGSSPIGITTGPDGNIWFAEFNSNTVAKFTW